MIKMSSIYPPTLRSRSFMLYLFLLAASPPSPTRTQNTSFATPTTKTVATPTTKTVATPSKFGGVANKWQPKQIRSVYMRVVNPQSYLW